MSPMRAHSDPKISQVTRGVAWNSWVPAAADLVVTDPLQAGVMTVMAVAETAKFSLTRLKHRAF
jgi:uncharacterized protein with ACT and thioredoxin-like domain